MVARGTCGTRSSYSQFIHVYCGAEQQRAVRVPEHNSILKRMTVIQQVNITGFFDLLDQTGSLHQEEGREETVGSNWQTHDPASFQFLTAFSSHDQEDGHM